MTSEAAPQPGKMRALLEHVARALVDDPSQVVVSGELDIASVRGPANVPIVRFDGYESRSDADRLRGRVLHITREAARKAAKGAYLWADLLGLVAETPDGTRLGIVREILRAGETDVLVVREEGTRAEVLLPALASVVREVDVAAGRVVVVPQDVLP